MTGAPAVARLLIVIRSVVIAALVTSGCASSAARDGDGAEAGPPIMCSVRVGPSDAGVAEDGPVNLCTGGSACVQLGEGGAWNCCADGVQFCR
jgi:hypothetical protein